MGYGRMTVANPIAVVGTMMTSHRVYDTFLSRVRKRLRIGDEWVPAWTPTTAGIIDVVPRVGGALQP